jgi:hypothetical protein
MVASALRSLTLTVSERNPAARDALEAVAAFSELHGG